MSEKRVLIVDDSPENIKILNEILKEDYTVMVTTNGQETLSVVKKYLPDIILLDIIMPVVDGYEVCRQLKNDHATSEIPIIFVTSKNKPEDEELGFCLGAVDYITRPFSSAVVKARVRTHLRIKYQQDLEIKQKALELNNLQLQKSKSLAYMAGGIAHLFNNYLYAVSGNLEMALEELTNDSLIKEYLDEAMKATLRCADVSGSMLTYLGHNFLQTESLDIVEFCRKHLSDFQSSIHNDIALEADFMDTELIVRVNANQMRKVLNHLITNACESLDGNKGKISLMTKLISASDIW